MSTYLLYLGRSAETPDPRLLDRLEAGFTAALPAPKPEVSRWTCGPLAVLFLAGDRSFSVASHPSGVLAMTVGRMDGRSDILPALRDRIAYQREPSDADMLAAAYAQWGRACFDRLIGDYVAFIWNPESRRLICARDRFGVVPCYYWQDSGEAVIAGHLGAVMGHSRVGREPDERYIAELLSGDIRARDLTLYRAVRRLPAGHMLHVQRAGTLVTDWGAWRPEADPLRLSENECDERYRHLLTMAITDRMRGLDSIGVEVSGGLDSSSVAALAAPQVADRYGERLKSFSLVFPGRSCDETRFIDDVVRHVGLDPHVVVNPSVPADLAEESRLTADLPPQPNTSAWHPLRALAHDAGVSALLTGVGGDQWFAPTRVYPVELLRRWSLVSSYNRTRQVSPMTSGLRMFYRHALRPLVADTLRRRQGVRPVAPPAWMAGGMSETLLEQRALRPEPSPRTSLEEREGWLRSGWEAHVHDALALAGLRGRTGSLHPFYDARLVDFAMQLDESHRWNGPQRRSIQRRAMSGLLPESVRTRASKAVFTELFTQQFVASGGRQRFQALSIASEAGWVRSDCVVEMYDDFRAGLRHGQVRHLWPLWMVLAVESWYATT